MREWPYVYLDFVVEAPDGSFAAFCLFWLDADNAFGEFAGAETAVVYSVAGSHGERLYAGLGLVTISRHLEYRRPA